MECPLPNCDLQMTERSGVKIEYSSQRCGVQRRGAFGQLFLGGDGACLASTFGG